MSSRMYEENRKSLNWFVGCGHDCVYCKPSFQRQMKRQGRRCQKCYDYEPHAHLERLMKAPPRTKAGEFIFFPSSGDPAFATLAELDKALIYVEKYSAPAIRRDFLTQSKDPLCFLLNRRFPDNLILGTTIETNKTVFNTPSYLKFYHQISDAPHPLRRYLTFMHVQHDRKEVTIEPILQFHLATLTSWIKRINPEFVYVGYDNHKCRLPEPTLAETQKLIDELEKITEVRIKTLRPAWYEVQERGHKNG